MYSLQFLYDEHGNGDLRLIGDKNRIEMEYLSRTGSINCFDELVGALPSGLYAIVNIPILTFQDGYWVSFGNGWFVQLDSVDKEGHLNKTASKIHPCGGGCGVPGSIGIIGTDAIHFRKRLKEIIDDQKQIPVVVYQQKEGGIS